MNNKLWSLLLLAGILSVQSALARTRPIAGGIAPDDKAEMVVSAPDSWVRGSDIDHPYEYRLVIRSRPAGKVLFHRLGDWQHSFFNVSTDGYDLQAWWSADSRWVALSFQSSSSARMIRLFSVFEDRKVREVTLPELMPRVLAALGGGRLKSLDVEPVAWSRHQLALKVSGTTADPIQGSPSIDFDFAATLQSRDRGNRHEADLSALQPQTATAGT